MISTSVTVLNNPFFYFVDNWLLINPSKLLLRSKKWVFKVIGQYAITETFIHSSFP